jgi:hypothetical protein
MRNFWGSRINSDASYPYPLRTIYALSMISKLDMRLGARSPHDDYQSCVARGVTQPNYAAMDVVERVTE